MHPNDSLSLSRCSSPGQQQSDGSPRGTEPGEVSGTQRNTSSASSSSPSGTDNSDDDDDDDDPDDMAGRSRPSSRQARAPLLEKVEDRERGRKRTLEDIKDLEAQDALTPQSQVVTALSPDVADAAIAHPPSFSRTSTVRSHSPTVESHAAARKKYLLAAVFLVVSLVSFVLQTELGRYVQHELGWNKAYCMLYLTHGSWSLLWPAQLLVLRLQKRQMSWQAFWRRHVDLLRSTAHMVAEQQLDVPHAVLRRSPVPYMVRTTAFVTSCLTIAGLTWYVAVNMTSPSDLTAIYNCSAFFAYAFSVPLLKEKLRLDKSLAVLVAVIGVLVVAYGDSVEGDADAASGTSTRLLGNLIIGAGSVLYGLYEVLYKRFACPPEGTSAWRGVIFANTFGSCIGSFTLLVFWIPLPILHVLGWETFEIPTGETALYLWTSVIMNAVFAGSFLVLISLTSPVLSSVAALLTIFIVAIADWLITGQALSFSALVGGAMIIVAFLVLSWSTWREMTEDAREKGGHSKNGGGGGGGGGVYQEAPMDWDSEDDDDDGHVS